MPEIMRIIFTSRSQLSLPFFGIKSLSDFVDTSRRIVLECSPLKSFSLLVVSVRNRRQKGCVFSFCRLQLHTPILPQNGGTKLTNPCVPNDCFVCFLCLEWTRKKMDHRQKEEQLPTLWDICLLTTGQIDIFCFCTLSFPDTLLFWFI